jgi:hypothetical protein
MTPETVCPTCSFKGDTVDDLNEHLLNEGRGHGRIPAQGPGWGKHRDRGHGFTHHAKDDCDPSNQKSPAEAEPGSPSDPSIPPTPAGGGELWQLLDTIFDIEGQYQMGGGGTVAENAALLPEYRAQQYIAINAYIARQTKQAFRAGQEDCRTDGDPSNHAHFDEAIARRVLEVIGEDEPAQLRTPAYGDDYEFNTEDEIIRNNLRAEQRQRIAVIKKESQ